MCEKMSYTDHFGVNHKHIVIILSRALCFEVWGTIPGKDPMYDICDSLNDNATPI